MGKPKLNFHEGYAGGHAVPTASERSFGQVFAGFFLILAALRWYRGGDGVWLFVGIAAVLLAIAYTVPILLRPFNFVWAKLGRYLFVVVSPLVMGLLFFVTITPLAVLLRVMGKDLLRLKRDGKASSYWIKREPPGPAPESMNQQF